MSKEKALRYLGYKKGTSIPPDIDALIDECLDEINDIANPKYIRQVYTLEHSPLTIKEVQVDINYPALVNLFRDCKEVIIEACTLGIQVDRKLSYYSKVNLTKMTILDAVASSYIEDVCDSFEQDLLSERTFRFCPGYGNVPMELNKTLANLLNTNKHIGLEVQDSYILLPQKSMIGLIGIGYKKTTKECTDCIQEQNCSYIKRGTTCYEKE